MKHNGDQFGDKPGAKWNGMTDEDMIEYEKYLEEAQKRGEYDNPPKSTGW